MRPPARLVVENLVWSFQDGSVWAVYRVPTKSYPYLHDREKLSLHGRLRAALLSLPEESMIFSVCRQVDPAELELRMLDGIDPEAHPAWAAESAATRAAVEDMVTDGAPMFERLHYLAFRLPALGRTGHLGALVGSASAGMMARFALPATPAPKAEVDAYKRHANEVASQLQALLGAVPATAGELRWLYARAPLRGLHEPRFDQSWEPTPRSLGEGPNARVAGSVVTHLFNDARFYEGGYRPDGVGRLWGKAGAGVEADQHHPRHRRYLRIDTDEGSTYQTFVVLSDLPRSWSFPGGLGEWFTVVDDSPFPIDWCARIVAVANEKAQVRARRQARELVAQVAEYESEPSGPPQVLAEAMAELNSERTHLATNPTDPELLVTTWFALADTSLPELETKARHVIGLFQPNEYGAHRPSGDQEALFGAMLPGSALPRVAKEYAQFLLPQDFASSMPFATSTVGDPDGILLGAARGGGSFSPVLAAFDRAPARNRSGSWAAFGGLGAGKSYFTKRAARAVLARGGQVVVADRTRHGEYVRFAEVCPGSHQVVQLSAASRFVLDPMRVFDGEERLQYATGFLALLAGTSPTELEGVVLAEAVEAVASRPGCRLGDVVDELEARGSRDPEARTVGRKLRAAARSKLAHIVFGEGEPLSLGADLIVFHLPGLALPDKATLTNAHLSRAILPEQLLGWALLYLVAAVTRHVTFADPRRYSAGIYDEARMLTLSPYGRQLLLEVVRDGRKHNAAAWIISQHPEDLGDSVGDDDRIADLLGYRLIFNQEPGAAASAVRFLGMTLTEHNKEMVTSLVSPDGRSRDALFTDSRGRVGRVQMFLELDPEVDAAFDTNPSTSSAGVVELRRREVAQPDVELSAALVTSSATAEAAAVSAPEEW